MKICITNQRKVSVAVYDIMRQTSRKTKAIRIHHLDRINRFFFSLLDQLHRIKAVAVSHPCYLFGYIHIICFRHLLQR
nr:MAG TPA: hypothetical protein [Caudoviricetes sp.]